MLNTRMMIKYLLLFLLFLFPTLAYGQTKADILSTSAVTLGTDEVRFMPEKLVSVDTSGSEVKTYIEPKIEFDKWNKENTLSLSIPSVEGYTDKTVDEKTGEVVIRNKTEGFYFKKYDGETVKFGLILYEIPSKDKIVTIDGIEYYQWQFKLEGWEEFDFFYQPPLKNINEDGSTWEEDIGGKWERPAGVSGGYACYHKTKKNYEENKINYGTGKLGFIYRPKFIDNSGRTIWAIIDIKEGIYSVLCLRDFIDLSSYPIKANDTFGNTTNGASTYDTGRAVALQSIPASSGTITKISIASDGGTWTVSGVYSDNGSDVPANRLAVGEGHDAPANTFADDVISLAITGSTKYWLCTCSSEGAKWKYDSTTSKSGAWIATSYADPHPGFATTYTDRRFSIYATYTPSGGGATPARRRIIIISKHETINILNRYTLSDCYLRRKVSRMA